jgi:hypothetical protein
LMFVPISVGEIGEMPVFGWLKSSILGQTDCSFNCRLDRSHHFSGEFHFLLFYTLLSRLILYYIYIHILYISFTIVHCSCLIIPMRLNPRVLIELNTYGQDLIVKDLLIINQIILVHHFWWLHSFPLTQEWTPDKLVDHGFSLINRIYGGYIYNILQLDGVPTCHKPTSCLNLISKWPK